MGKQAERGGRAPEPARSAFQSPDPFGQALLTHTQSPTRLHHKLTNTSVAWRKRKVMLMKTPRRGERKEEGKPPAEPRALLAELRPTRARSQGNSRKGEGQLLDCGLWSWPL